MIEKDLRRWERPFQQCRYCIQTSTLLIKSGYISYQFLATGNVINSVILLKLKLKRKRDANNDSNDTESLLASHLTIMALGGVDRLS